MFAIIYSIYITIALYQVVDSLVHSDSNEYVKKPLFRGDHTSSELRDIIYERIDFYYDDEDEYEDDDIPYLETKEGFALYSPFQVCYVNSYIVYDSNSTSFDYSRETEYNIEQMYDQFAELNKMYIVFDDIHMVFSIRDQQCIKYPDIYRNDEL